MADAIPALVVLVPALAAIGGGAAQLGPSAAAKGRISQAAALLTAAAALALGLAWLAGGAGTQRGGWYLVDARGVVMVAVIAGVGLASALLSPAWLRGGASGFFSTGRAAGAYHLAFHLFWAALFLIPLLDNLGTAWLLIEATTGASALLVAHSGRRSALEAGWKYLVLTSVGLTVTLLGIVMLYAVLAPAGGGLGVLDWESLTSAHLPHLTAVAAFTLVVAGLAAKIGWAPVHHWLPDAHSEAPPSVSALLSAALLPAVMLVAWRAMLALTPAVGAVTAARVFIGFGLASLAVAVPFLWMAQPWKRLLAYSSLEHMGVLALGIGFDQPLAIAGVAIHVAGHALAKALGFYLAIPLVARHPSAARHAARGVGLDSPRLAAGMALSLGTLAGLPPLPLFFSEVLIILGGIAAGQVVPAAIAALLLALGFAGLAHALVEGIAGRPRETRVEVSVAAASPAVSR